MITRTSRGALACALLASTCLAAPALAQSPGSIPPPPVRQTLDDNGVDVIRGTFAAGQTDAAIGPAWPGGLSFSSLNFNAGWFGAIRSEIVQSGSTYVVTIDGASDRFTEAGGVFTSTEGDGATLVLTGNVYTYTGRGGVAASFLINASPYPLWDMNLARATSVTYPDGTILTYTYKTANYCPDGTSAGSNCTDGYYTALRLQSVHNNRGYQLKLTYESNTITGSIPNLYERWSKLASVKAINNAVEYCNPNADSCALTGAWPSVSLSQATPTSPLTITDAAGRATRYTSDSANRIVAIKRPGSAADSVVIGYGASGVASVTRDGVTHSYAYADAGSTRTTTVTDPNGGQKVYVGDTGSALLQSYRDELGRTTTYSHDGNGRVTRITSPEANYTHYGYDARGNVTETRAVSKTPGAPADVVTSASYPASCANPKTCNKPSTTTDARGAVTDYSYDAGHGGLLSVTLPAQPNGVRPQTRLSYAAQSAYFKTHTGAIVQSPTAVVVPVGVSACQTGSSCVGTADEVKTTIAYGAAGAANNLLPTSVSSGAGDGSLTATQTMSYDGVGNLLTLDGPLPGIADTSRAHYDAIRRVVGSVSPDPDGAGALKHRAQRISYNADSQVTKQEAGTVADQSDGAWAGFAPLEAVEIGYDANARAVTSKLIGSDGAAHALTQTSYDALGRAECNAQRMNTAAFGSLPANACTLGAQGSFGSDRIGKTIYNAASEATQIRVAVGTADEAAEASASYTNNGRLFTLTDGENNRTTYVYDGHDRLSQTQFPSPIKGAGVSNAADYEQLGYDAGGNFTSRRLRDGQSIFYGYDNLSRLVSKNLPNSIVWEFDASYTHDNLGRLTAATDTNTHAVRFSYDALGRVLSEGSDAYGAKTFQYDLGGRRTRLTWRDGVFVSYEYLQTGETSAIRENGAGSGVGVLASFGYDDLGRRASLTRGNGTVTSYSHDPVSRLASLTQDIAGAGSDLTLTFAYNPASQIASNTRSNDAFAWTGHETGTTGSSANGLNQLTVQSGTGFSFDAKGNMTSNGVRTFGYTAENLLATMNGNPALAYDPLGRLYYTAPTAVWSDYDGSAQVAEIHHPTNSIVRRYVHGPGIDEPLVWYEGAGTSDRRWLHADERGSIVAVSDGAGNATAINKYDEYGKPQGTLAGRFGYTGQAWLPELELFYYKARMYDPRGPRFLQTDPIGSTMNDYVYTSGDPINRTDPTGLKDRVPGASGGTACVVLDISGTCDDSPAIVVTAPRVEVGGGPMTDWMRLNDLFPGAGRFDEGRNDGGEVGDSVGGGEAQSVQCPAVPSPGLGRAELNRRANASAARAANRNRDVFSIPRADNRVELFMKSLPGARNDTKSHVRRSDEYGNFLFGAEAAAGGLTLQEAMNWGRNAQMVQDLGNLRLPSGRDNAGDAAAIQQGHRYYTTGCTK